MMMRRRSKLSLLNNSEAGTCIDRCIAHCTVLWLCQSWVLVMEDALDETTGETTIKVVLVRVEVVVNVLALHVTKKCTLTIYAL